MHASATNHATVNPMVLPPKFAALTPEQIKAELLGFPEPCIDAALRFHSTGDPEDVLAMLPGMIEFHLPGGAPKLTAELGDHLRLNQDLGLDSLSLTEMAFKMDDLFDIAIEIREMTGVETVGDLKAFLLRKLGAT
jgi:acyl carrier protein